MRFNFTKYWLALTALLLVFTASKAQISGTVKNDVTGLSDATINGTGTNAGGLNAFLIDTVTNNVVAVNAVTATGDFSFTNPNTGIYRVRISTTVAAVGAPAPVVTLPTNWVNTGEFLGTGVGNDGLIDGILYVGPFTLGGSIADLNFGIQQRPTSGTIVAPQQGNPPGMLFVTVDPLLFSGTDPDGGIIDSIRIVSFPTNVNILRIDGNTTYNAATFPITGLRVRTNLLGQPVPSIEVDPVAGNITVNITYKVVDNANFESTNNGSVALPLINRMDVVDNQTALALVQKLTGEGVIVLNPVLNCAGIANGVFNVIGTSNLGIDSGIVLTSGRAMTSPAGSGVNGPNNNLPGPAASNGFPGDPQLNVILNGLLSSDVCKLEFDFVPSGDSIKFDYVFGSTEYQSYSCSGFNDVFGFLITGPGFATPFNMATVPGTNIPVCVNSTTGVGAWVATDPDCTVMGPGSPFSMYYINNMGGATVTYGGFTTIFTARAGVNPCDTYHLKLAIGDGSSSGIDQTLDSGVFLKAGSLNSATLTVKTLGGGGLEVPFTNTVRGCPPGVIRVSRSSGLAAPITIPLIYQGTAVPGIDYTALPPNITIPAGDSVASLLVHGIPVSPAAGPRSVIVKIISPYTCNGDTIVISSDTIMIYDSVYLNIITPDTNICREKMVNVQVEADDFLEFLWTPTTLVSDSLGKNVTLMPTDSTTFTLRVNMPGMLGTGCPATTAKITVKVKDTPQVDLGPDKFTCGASVQLHANTSPPNPDESFEWTPATGLSSTTIRNPIATTTTNMQYVVKVNPGAEGCDGFDTILVRLLPDHITVLNNDTILCAGTVLSINANADTNFFLNWTPELHIADPFSASTTLTAVTSGTYTLTASFPGCDPMSDSFYLEVQPIPVVEIGDNRIICTYDTLQLYAGVNPSNYNNYSYAWTPVANMSNAAIKNPVYTSDDAVTQLVRVTVTTPIGCTGTAAISVATYQGDFLMVPSNDTGICPPSQMQMGAWGAQTYLWSPSASVSNANIANPIASPSTATEYSVLGSIDYGNHICYDTQKVFVDVYPAAIINMPDSVTIFPGEGYQIEPQTNCSYFEWFPPSGLSSTTVANPYAKPEVRTRYFVTARTEQGCVVVDSIDILVNTESIIDVPNAFIPNNGSFKVVRRGDAQLKYFRVFNRWGNKVFETNNINEGWDGTFNGKAQPMGVYIYSVEAVTNTGKPIRKDGNVTLMR